MIYNGQKANEENFGKAFGSKMTNNTFAGTQALDNEASGNRIANVQKAINQCFEVLGTLEGEVDALKYDANYILDGESLKAAIKKLDTKLKEVVDNVSGLQSPMFIESAFEVIADTITIPAQEGLAIILVSAAEAKALSSTPFGATKAWRDGVTITLVGQGANAITLPFADADEGCLLNGSMTLKEGASITLRYSLSMKRFLEIGRYYP